MLRKIGWVFTLIGMFCILWIMYSWSANLPIDPYFFLGAMMIMLGGALTRKPGRPNPADPDGIYSPSARRQNKGHRSWISLRDDN